MRVGSDLVFQDVDDIKPGSDWFETIHEELRSCAVFLVLIGQRWLVDSRGHRRLDDSKDVLRLEIVEALSGKGTVIPVLVGGAPMPSPKDLPVALKQLARRQALTLRDEHLIADTNTLIERLRELILPTIEQMSLHHAKRELRRMQLEYFDLLDAEPARALELAQRTQKFLDRGLQLYPQDPDLKVTRGYLFKNEAMALGNFERYDEEETALKRGEQVFRTMLEEDPKDAGAWNGLGSIEGVRGNYREAIGYIDHALAIMPDYDIARRDRSEMERALKKTEH